MLADAFLALRFKNEISHIFNTSNLGSKSSRIQVKYLFKNNLLFKICHFLHYWSTLTQGKMAVNA
jgi:hypothetical protein